MVTNRVWEVRGRYDPVGAFGADTARKTVLLAIEEVIGESTRETESTTVAVVPETRLAAPASAPRRGRARRSRRRHTRRRQKPKNKLSVVALALALALGVGAIVGSGLLNSEDRYNAEIYSAQQAETEIYVVPEVHGHPGSAPRAERSGSIRQFLGMASAF
jgi:hypothetical protein